MRVIKIIGLTTKGQKKIENTTAKARLDRATSILFNFKENSFGVIISGKIGDLPVIVANKGADKIRRILVQDGLRENVDFSIEVANE